jgi:hypothetical protein
MKSILPALFSFFLFGEVMSQTFSGNVIDAYDKKYLEGVDVSINGHVIEQTNSRGYFSVSGTVGDTLKLNFPGFLERKVVLGDERFLLLEIQDRARLLPTFQVNAEPYRFRFKDGKLTLVENEIEEEKPFAQQAVGGSDKYSLNPNFSIYGPISYFTRRNRQLRQYDRFLEWEKRRRGYLAVIDSDSIRNELMARFELDRSSWDEMIIRFNEFHQSHEFLDWSEQRVRSTLEEFIRLERTLSD